MESRKVIIALLLLPLFYTQAKAQTRKYIAHFSEFRQYFNPALTGHGGSQVQALVRNHWAGMADTPKTFLLTSSVDLAELSSDPDYTIAGKNTIGLNMLSDKFGPFTDTELTLNYSSRIRINKTSTLQLGAGASYNSVRLDGTNLSPRQIGDPTVGKYLNRFAFMNILDFNLGIALSNSRFYLGTAVHHINKGALSSGDIFMDRKPQVFVINGGFNQSLREDVLLISNILFRAQKDLPDNLELDIKVVLKESFLFGVGHRLDYAQNFHLGWIKKNFQLGYIYEIPLKGSFLLPNSTHEFRTAYFLFK